MKLTDILEEHSREELGTVPDRVLFDLEERLDSLGTLSYLLTEEHRSVNPPLYHKAGETKGHYVAILSEYVPYLQALIQVRYSKAYTYVECTERLTKAGYVVSSTGQINNIFNRMETKLGLKDKRLPQQRIADKNRANREIGIKRPRTSAQKKVLIDAGKIKAAKDNVNRLAKESAKAKKALAAQAAKKGKTANEVLGKPRKATKGNTQQIVDRLPEELKEREILYAPHPKQQEFHEAGETCVLYGGAAGGGKSYSMLMDALRYCMHWDYRALIIRKTSPMLKELISVSRALYPKAYPGATFNKQENVWYFPTGATIQFGYLNRDEDLENYQGLPYAYIGFDEIQHQRSPAGFEYLMSRLRTTNPAITAYMRASANPGGAAWVKEYFIDPSVPGETFWKNGLSWKFIPAKLEDNPSLDTPKEGESVSQYRRMLMALPETQRKQLLEGDWLAGDDNMFSFIPSIHITKDEPPLHWNRIRAMDYGFRDPAATLWAAVSPDNKIVVYDEHELIGVPAAEWAKQVMAKERADNMGFGIHASLEEVIDWSLFKNVGHTGPGILEQVRAMGMRPRPADRAREAGWNQIHNRLELNELNEPSIYIHERCERLIEQVISSQIHPKKPDDIDDTRAQSKGRKHHWDLLDTLRYLCMSRPSTISFSERSLRFKQVNGMDAVWEKFGR